MSEAQKSERSEALTRKAQTIRDLLTANRDKFGEVATTHLTAERLVRVAIAAITRSPKLLECTTNSLLLAVMDAARLGLEPTGRYGGAYLVPYKSHKTGISTAELQVDYRGLVALVRRSRIVAAIRAHVVYEKDKFSYQLGDNPKVTHKPALKERGAPVCVYAIARLHGVEEIEAEVMTVEEVEAVRARSRAAKDGPWVTDWGQMARKTVLRRICNYLPLTVEAAEQLAVVDKADTPTVLAEEDEPRPPPSRLDDLIQDPGPEEGEKEAAG